MARQRIQYATIKATISIKYDGANIEQVVLDGTIWLSDKFYSAIMAAASVIGLVRRVIGYVWRDLVATYRHNRQAIVNAPQWMSIYFLVRYYGKLA